MITVFAKHKVNDYNAWKSAYDKATTIRKDRGVIGASVFRDTNSPNDVIVTHHFNDLNTARNFFNSADLKDAMHNGGVVNDPEVWFAEDIEQTNN